MSKFGLVIEDRKPGDYIIFKRTKPPTKAPKTVVYGPELSAAERYELGKRCDSIVQFYPDPYKSEGAIRQRLNNFAQSLPLSKREYISNYLKENFPNKLEV